MTGKMIRVNGKRRPSPYLLEFLSHSLLVKSCGDKLLGGLIVIVMR